MKKWVMVLGCYGLLVGSASAGERWPEGPCRDTQKELAGLEQLSARNPLPDKIEGAVGLATSRMGLLTLLRDHCLVDVRAKIALDIAAFNASSAQIERKDRPAMAHRPPAARQPMNCTTIKLDDDMSTTNCF